MPNVCRFWSAARCAGHADLASEVPHEPSAVRPSLSDTGRGLRSVHVRGARRFSQAISEGDGISVIVDVDDPESARAAESQGAEGLAVRGELAGVRAATELPILWRAPGPLEQALDAGADAYLLSVDSALEEEGRLERLHARVLELGLDCVVQVRSEEELEQALERIDPEIFLLATRSDGDDALERALELLPDVPAGKLAVAEVPASTRQDVAALERAGVDAVIVGVADLGGLAADVRAER